MSFTDELFKARNSTAPQRPILCTLIEEGVGWIGHRIPHCIPAIDQISLSCAGGALMVEERRNLLTAGQGAICGTTARVWVQGYNISRTMQSMCVFSVSVKGASYFYSTLRQGHRLYSVAKTESSEP